MNSSYFITGIGTGIGKTIAAAVLVQYFRADYWKPIQSGDLDNSDSICVRRLVDQDLYIHKERYRLNFPASPHQSAEMDGIQIRLADFQLPRTTNSLLVEGAGGLFVPFNQNEFMIDMIEKFNIPIILVIRDYLGCINHTLLSLAAIQQRKLPLAYVVFNGPFVPETKRMLLAQLPPRVIWIEIPELADLNRREIKRLADNLQINFKR